MIVHITIIKKVRCNSFELLQKLINKWSTDINTIKSIGFMSYDIKNIIYPHISFKKLKSNFPFFGLLNQV